MAPFLVKLVTNFLVPKSKRSKVMALVKSKGAIPYVVIIQFGYVSHPSLSRDINVLCYIYTLLLALFPRSMPFSRC